MRGGRRSVNRISRVGRCAKAAGGRQPEAAFLDRELASRCTCSCGIRGRAGSEGRDRPARGGGVRPTRPGLEGAGAGVERPGAHSEALSVFEPSAPGCAAALPQMGFGPFRPVWG
ncbi:hypothetical protein EJ06DRAFT_257667 [Trichodelitschia bisporula]|uniref:Uncharacterized protein n=1 Tax=Trichodelitschia bisporula TaxID=703511 RepID=A0A6G1HJ40_9PEZI|nr:hypothetical protein EJ06DRAFT_257667 [Trichodelitschia bisporula]